MSSARLMVLVSRGLLMYDDVGGDDLADDYGDFGEPVGVSGAAFDSQGIVGVVDLGAVVACTEDVV